MNETNSTTIEQVRSLIAGTLGIEDRMANLDAATQLLGGLPEFDSMAVVELIAAIESRFGVELTDDEVTGELFETIGSVAAFVDSKLSPS